MAEGHYVFVIMFFRLKLLDLLIDPLHLTSGVSEAKLRQRDIDGLSDPVMMKQTV